MQADTTTSFPVLAWRSFRELAEGWTRRKKAREAAESISRELEVIKLADLTFTLCWNELWDYLGLDSICPAIRIMITEHPHTHKLALMEYDGHRDYDRKKGNNSPVMI